MRQFSSFFSTPTLLFLTLFLINQHPSLQSVITQYEIKDLEGNEAYFISDTKNWNSTALSITTPAIYTFCSQRYILGGRGVLANNQLTGAYLERTYLNLPPHTAVYFTLHLWIMKGWDVTDILYFEFDSYKFNDLANITVQTSSVDQCGGTWMADIGLVRIYGAFPHSSSSLKLRITGKNNEDPWNEAFGLRNINLMFSYSSTITTKLSCIIVSTTLIPGSTTVPYVSLLPAAAGVKCACPESMYWVPGTPTGSCINCHMSCSSCYGPTAKECFKCQEGYAYNGKQCSACDTTTPSCTKCTGGGGLLDSQYACKECHNFTMEYLRPTSSGHEFRLILRPFTCDIDQEALRKYLTATPADAEIFPNFYFNVKKVFRGFYLVEIVLDSSLVVPVDIDVFLQYMNTTINIPRKFIASSTLQNFESAVQVSRVVLLFVIILSIIGTSIIGATPAIWSLITFMQFIGYLRYLDIEYPVIVDLFFSVFESADWGPVPNLFSLMTSGISEGIVASDDVLSRLEDSLPSGVFIQHEQKSFFIENAGAIVLSTIIIALLLLFSFFGRKSSRGNMAMLVKKLNSVLQWNYFLRHFLLSSVPLTLAIFLQFKMMVFDSVYQSLCAVFSLFSFAYVCTVSVFIIKFLVKNDYAYLKKTRIESEVGTLYAGISMENQAGKYYHLLVFLRGLLLALTISFINTIPFLQISLLIYYNIGFTLYLFGRSHFRDGTLKVINRAKEIMVLIGEVFVLCINVQVRSTMYYDVMQWLILSTLGPVLILELLYVVGLQITGGAIIVNKISDFFKSFKTAFKKEKNTSISLDNSSHIKLDRSRTHDESDFK